MSRSQEVAPTLTLYLIKEVATARLLDATNPDPFTSGGERQAATYIHEQYDTAAATDTITFVDIAADNSGLSVATGSYRQTWELKKIAFDAVTVVEFPPTEEPRILPSNETNEDALRACLELLRDNNLEEARFLERANGSRLVSDHVQFSGISHQVRMDGRAMRATTLGSQLKTISTRLLSSNEEELARLRHRLELTSPRYLALAGLHKLRRLRRRS